MEQENMRTIAESIRKEAQMPDNVTSVFGDSVKGEKKDIEELDVKKEK